MTKKEQFTGLAALAHDMRTDIFEAFVRTVGELAELDRKLTAVDNKITQVTHEAEITHVITHRQLLKTKMEDLKAVTDAFTKPWYDTMKQLDGIIIERMQAMGMKTVTVDGLGKMTRASRRNYKVGDISEFAADIQQRVVNGEDLQQYIDLFGTSLGVSKLDDMLDDGMTPINGVESTSSATLRFTSSK